MHRNPPLPALHGGGVKDPVVLVRPAVVLRQAVREGQAQQHLPQGEGLQGLLQREGEVVQVVQLEEEGQLLGPHQLQQLLHHAAALLLGVALHPLRHPEPAQSELFARQQVQRHRQRLVGHASVGDQGAVRGQGAGQQRGRVAAHAVEGQSDGGQLPGDLLEAAGLQVLVRHHQVPAQIRQQPHRGGGIRPVGADHVEGPYSAGPGQLDDGLPHHAVGAVLHQPVPGPQTLEVLQHTVRAAGIHGHCGCVGGRDVVGHPQEVGRLGLGPLGPGG
mmetsp:Transcript_26771/g.36870  ORF Transcript_26771/g.36870 Transcript_26771/m.36870 type:complete len:274 (-) Transcript_26771:1188-2009(-)